MTNKAREMERAKTLKDLENDLTALKLRMAFQAELEEEIAQADTDAADPAVQAFAERIGPRVLRQIRGESGRMQRRYLARRVLPKVARVVACLMLEFYLGLTVAVATIQPVRVGVMDFIMQMEEEYTSLELQPTGTYVEIPPEWKGEYFPTYVPEGFEVEKVNGMRVFYENEFGDRIAYFELDRAYESNIDSKDVLQKYVIIDGLKCFVTEKDGVVLATWQLGNRYFAVKSNVGLDATYSIIENVEKIP